MAAAVDEARPEARPDAQRRSDAGLSGTIAVTLDAAAGLLASGPEALYFANQKLFRTARRRRHWSAISPDLTPADAGTPANLDPVTARRRRSRRHARRGVVYTIAPSPLAKPDLGRNRRRPGLA